MAPGLLLWISCFSLLLDDIVGFTGASEDGDFRVSYANQNLDVDDFNTFNFDQGEGESLDHLSGLVPPNYIKPVVAEPPKIPVAQAPAYTKSGNEVEKIVNGASRQWQSNLFEPIIFPLTPVYSMVAQMPQKLAAGQPQSQFLVYTSKNTFSPAIGETPLYGNQIPAQPSPYMAVLAPTSQIWQTTGPVMAGSPYGFLYQQAYTSSSPGDRSKPAAPFFVSGLPDVSKGPLSSRSNVVGFKWSPAQYSVIPQQVSILYPRANANPESSAPEGTAEQYSQGNEIESAYASSQPPAGGQSRKDWVNFPVQATGNENPYLEQLSQQPHNSVKNTEKYWVPKVRYPTKAKQLLSPRKSFLVRSKNNYQRKRYLQTKTSYTPTSQNYAKNQNSRPAQIPVRKTMQRGSISFKA